MKELQGVDTEMLDALRKDEEVKRRKLEVATVVSAACRGWRVSPQQLRCSIL